MAICLVYLSDPVCTTTLRVVICALRDEGDLSRIPIRSNLYHVAPSNLRFGGVEGDFSRISIRSNLYHVARSDLPLAILRKLIIVFFTVCTQKIITCDF